MRTINSRLLLLTSVIIFLQACQQEWQTSNVTFIRVSSLDSVEIRQFSSSTFSAKRTYEARQKGEFFVAQNCENASNKCEYLDFFRFVTPSNAGLYWAVAEKIDGQKFSFPISVIDRSVKKACLLNQSFTYQAYSNVGGYNFYKTPYNRPLTVSLNRPIETLSSSFHGYGFSLHRVLSALEVDHHVIDDRYLTLYPDVLDSCSSLVFGGHSEYWSIQMLKAIEAFVLAGGDIINLSGNIAYWIVDYNETEDTITVDKRKSEIKRNRIKAFNPKIVDYFGGYYLGYPVKRKLNNAREYFESFPVTANNSGVTYEDFRHVVIEDPSHPAFSCLDDKQKFDDVALTIELDGVLLYTLVEGSEGSTAESDRQVSDVKGSLVSGWAIYGKQLRHIVLARDYENIYGGRVLFFGSIGWAENSRENPVTKTITEAALSDFFNINYKCN